MAAEDGGRRTEGSQGSLAQPLVSENKSGHSFVFLLARVGGREEGREDGEGVRDKKAEEGREKVSLLLLLQWNTGFSIKSGSSSPSPPIHIRTFQSPTLSCSQWSSTLAVWKCTGPEIITSHGLRETW